MRELVTSGIELSPVELAVLDPKLQKAVLVAPAENDPGDGSGGGL